MSEILTLNRNNHTFQSETLPEIMKTLEADGKIKKINTERSIGKDVTTYLAVVNEHPDTVYYIDVKLGERYSAQDEPTREYFINYPNGENPTTEITDKIVTENPPKISVWEVVKPPRVVTQAPEVVTPAKKSVFDFNFKNPFTRKGGRKSRKSRKSRKQRKSRRTRR